VRDLVRQCAVAASAAIAIVGALLGSGALGGKRLGELAGGALRPDATPLAPGAPAFAIWTVIYLGLVGYAVWQFLPSQRASARHRRLGYLIAVSMLLNAAWLMNAQLEELAMSVPIVVALTGTLVAAMRRCVQTPPRGTVDAVITDGTVGLYLGWSILTVFANVTAVLAAGGFDGVGVESDSWAVAILALLGGLGVALGAWTGGRVAPAIAIAWGLGWIAAERLLGGLPSMPTAVAALVSAVVILGFTAAVRFAGAGQPRYSADSAGANVSHAPAPASYPVLNQR